MNRKLMSRYLIAIYVIVGTVAIILGIFAFFRDADTWQSVLLNLSTELLGVVLVFFLVNYLFLIEDWNLSERVEKLLDSFDHAENPSLDKRFFSSFPDSIRTELNQELKEAEDVLLLGVSFGKTLDQHKGLLQNKLQKGDKVRWVIINPNSPACAMTATRQYLGDKEDVWAYKVKNGTLKRLIEFQANSNGNMEVRLIDFPLANGGIYINPTSNKGKFFVWYYGFKTTDANRPKFVVRPTDIDWYSLFQEEAERIWEFAIPVPSDFFG